jgi:choline kinase
LKLVSYSKLNSKFTVLITTSGVGSRLGDLTQFTNKSLIVVGKKPVLAHIIEKYPLDTTFVVTLGHFGEQVKEFLAISYPERIFKFVNVDRFEGTGSSLGYSMVCAREHLQLPFIYHASDTLILNSTIPEADINWVAGFKGTDATNYASFDTQGEFIVKFHDKGMANFDFVHIGLVGIHSYEEFWSKMENLIMEQGNSNDVNDVSAIDELLKNGINFAVKVFDDWIDIGNSNSLVLAKEKMGTNSNVLEKPEESVSFIKDTVVKFFSDPKIVSSRVNRVEFLGETIPRLRNFGKNFFSYEYFPGEVMSDCDNPDLIISLLNWAKENLWSKIPENPISNFNLIANTFYNSKSKNRLKYFISSRLVKDEPIIINDLLIPSADSLIESSTKELIENIKIGRFHGDFILDNILLLKSDFKLIDWRQDFGGNLEFGDIYYDLAKLNHSLHINHRLVQKGNFFVSSKELKVSCGILRRDVHVEMEYNLKKFVESEKLSWRKVQILTSLIWLNMAPLHHHPFDRFLYFYGRYNLWRALNDQKN